MITAALLILGLGLHLLGLAILIRALRGHSQPATKPRP